MHKKPKSLSRIFLLGRLLCHCSWCRKGLWYNDVAAERYFYWFYVGSVTRDNKKAFSIILFKAKLIVGLLPSTNEG